MSGSNEVDFSSFPPRFAHVQQDNGFQLGLRSIRQVPPAQPQQYGWNGGLLLHSRPYHPLPGSWRRQVAQYGFCVSPNDPKQPHGLTLEVPGHEVEGDIPPPPPPPPPGNARSSNLNASAPSFTPRETRSIHGARITLSEGVRLDGDGYSSLPPPGESTWRRARAEGGELAPPPPPPVAPGPRFTAARQWSLPERPRNNFSLKSGSLYRDTQQHPPRVPRQHNSKQATQSKNPVDIPAPATPPKQPEPSIHYLLRSTQQDLTLDVPRPLLVVLDLNGTLLFRPGRNGGINFQARPHVDNFLRYLFRNHHVMIWSSAMPSNVRRMCKKLLTSGQMDKLIACWGRDTLRLSKANYATKVQVYKQLDWVWNDDVIKAEKGNGAIWNQDNTVLIDDSKLKAASEPFNLIEIEEFEGREDQMGSDVLGQVASYLEHLRWVANVSAHIRLLPFVYDAEKEFDWASVRTDVI